MTDLHCQRPGIIGTGRVALALALALRRHATEPPMLWGRSPETARSAASRVGAVTEPGLDRLLAACDVIAIAVADDALTDVVSRLAAALPAGPSPFIFHVSGRSGAAALEPLGKTGAMVAAIHPAMTFTGDPESEVGRMAGARFAITAATGEAIERARRVVASLGGVAVEIAEERRALYHAALCHASNHLVTLISGAAHGLERAGVDDPAALLAPLVRAALDNSLTHGFAGLSGPLLRGDAQTISGHLETLGALSPDLLPAYRAMAAATIDELQRRETLPPDRLAALDSLLAVP
ncbi:DUF2520 domain-containing protein [Sphingopyxis sp. PAMC25046]|uniref:Rossmann-like and DUF2520 domain-containing protein n=1 Tax=Sphingopyxis sp. PAMC25046 TaxID=2565556 RepID=UPI00109DF354|nr:Rossmann-like and DUF2520 domain-containing protein [Sphingopyxis sp. PAMC25046]QCB55043.1 DUF2520 domain-containing protein [Sphingopyxis sp. PAMC25046]